MNNIISDAGRKKEKTMTPLEQGLPMLHQGRMMLCCGGLFCALWDVEQHPWPSSLGRTAALEEGEVE